MTNINQERGGPDDGRPWYRQPFDVARAVPLDRASLAAIGEAYLDALERKDSSALALAEEVWATENTARLEFGEGLLWRAAIEATDFRISVVDPATGQAAFQAVYLIEGRPALVAIRVGVERGMITEVEHLIDRNVAPQAMELLATPRAAMLDDLPPQQRSSRALMIHAAHAYFDALTGEDGRIAPFTHDCVRHEQGYRTAFNPVPGRGTPRAELPDLSTETGRFLSRLSMMTCEEQIDTQIFNGIKRIWPRRVVAVDEAKGLVATFPLFVHDGTRRPVAPGSDAAKRGGLAMVLNMVTMETFAIRDDRIHAVEAFPFVTIPYGAGDGWTPARAR